jgi:hypothetical protein
MIVLAAGSVASDAAKKSKQRKQLNYQMVLEKAETERQATEQLRKNKQEALKAIAINYVESQQKAKQEKELKKKKEMQRNIAIAAGAGVVLITVGYLAYKKII